MQQPGLAWARLHVDCLYLTSVQPQIALVYHRYDMTIFFLDMLVPFTFPHADMLMCSAFVTLILIDLTVSTFTTTKPSEALAWHPKHLVLAYARVPHDDFSESYAPRVSQPTMHMVGLGMY